MKTTKNLKLTKIKNFFFLLLCCTFFLIFVNFKRHPTPKKVFFIVSSESIGGKGVYEIYKEMKNLGHHTKIVALPFFYGGDLLNDIDLKFTEKFDEKDVIYPCGKQGPYKRCSSLEEFKPDYIFTQNPYTSYDGSPLSPFYSILSLKKIAKKVMYIVYGPHLFHQHSINDPNLPNYVDTVFVDSLNTKEIYSAYYNFQRNNVVISGYQTYKQIRDLRKNRHLHHKSQETILWLPRWTLTFFGRDQGESGSTFLNYYHFFYNYALTNPQINFILRPHTLLLPYAVKNQYLTQQEADEIVQKFKSLKNISWSEHAKRSLVDDIMQADIVIADGTSSIAEAVVADKPIIYLSNGLNKEFDSVYLSKELKKYIYFAYSAEDIKKQISEIRATKYKPTDKYDCEKLRCFTRKIKENLLGRTMGWEDFKKALDPVENPAKFIAEYILYDKI